MALQEWKMHKNFFYDWFPFSNIYIHYYRFHRCCCISFIPSIEEGLSNLYCIVDNLIIILKLWNIWLVITQCFANALVLLVAEVNLPKNPSDAYRSPRSSLAYFSSPCQASWASLTSNGEWKIKKKTPAIGSESIRF